MKLDYRNFSYTARFSYVLIEDGKTIADENVMQGAACFGRIFSFLKRSKTYEAVYKIKCLKNFEKYSGNYCSLDLEQIRKTLRYMRETFDIGVQLENFDDHYLFTFTVKGLAIKHKVVLTFSRVFFEYPYNELAKDVFRLRQAGVVDGINYSHKGFMELFHLMNITYKDFWASGHCLFAYPCYDFSIKPLKEAFEQGTDRVQNIYDGDYDIRGKIKNIRFNRSGIDWDDDFDQRVVTYSENFQILKQLKHEKGIRRRARKALQ